MRRADRSVVMTATFVIGSYRPLPEPPTFVSHAANVAKTLRSGTPAKLYKYETLLEGLAEDLQDVAATFRSASSNRTPWCAHETSPGIGMWPPPISPASEMV